MLKVFYVIIMSLGIICGIILFIENMIGSSGIAYIIIWQSSVQALVLFSLLCGFFIGYGMNGFFSYDNENKNHENF